MSNGVFSVGADDSLESILSGDLDIVGLDDIFSGDLDIVGADRMRKLAAVGARALRGGRTAGQMSVLDRTGGILRRQALPFPKQSSIASTAQATLSGAPQQAIRVERPVVPSYLARFFDITGLNVGTKPQFMATGTINAQVFSEVAQDISFQGDTCNPAITIAIIVQNIDTVAHELTAMIVGTTVDS